MLLIQLEVLIIHSMQLFKYITIILMKYQVYNIHKLLISLSLFFLLDIVDSSGFIFTYTNTPRQYDAGILFFGHAIVPAMVIPPNAYNFTTIGLCTNGCTQTVSLIEDICLH